MRQPIWRKVFVPRTGKWHNFVLDEIAYCETCEEVKRFGYCGETPDDIAHWECKECGNESEELNKEEEK